MGTAPFRSPTLAPREILRVGRLYFRFCFVSLMHVAFPAVAEEPRHDLVDQDYVKGIAFRAILHFCNVTLTRFRFQKTHRLHGITSLVTLHQHRLEASLSAKLRANDASGLHC